MRLKSGKRHVVGRDLGLGEFRGGHSVRETLNRRGVGHCADVGMEFKKLLSCVW